MTGDLHLMQLLMALLTTIPTVILLGLDPMVTAEIPATQHKMVIWTLVQTPAAGVLLIGCHHHHHHLVLQVTNTIKWPTYIDWWLIFSLHFWWGRPLSPISWFKHMVTLNSILLESLEEERESEEGRVFVYIEDYNYLVSGSQGLARWIQGSLEIQLLYSIQFFSILIKF